MTGKEVISVHVGGSGTKVGRDIWNLLNTEHDITCKGKKEKPAASPVHKFYQEHKGTFTPRALFVDCDEMDSIRLSPHLTHLEDSHFIQGTDTASSFARARYTLGKDLAFETMERIRKQFENCDNAQGIMWFSSASGGTGSGLGSAILEEIANDMGKTSTFAFALFPGQSNHSSIVEPYNTTLAMHSFIEYAAAVLVVDNQALQRLCQKHLDISSISYVNMNRIFAQVYSNMTASMRFSNAGLNHTLAQMHENLIVVPRLHFLVSSISPIAPATDLPHMQAPIRRMPRFVEAFQPRFRNDSLNLLNMTRSVFLPDSHLAECDPVQGWNLSCCLHYRGTVSPRSINSALAMLKARGTVKLVDWSPNGFRVGITGSKPRAVRGSSLFCPRANACLISNNTSIHSVFRRQRLLFESMFCTDSFLHWFTREGMDRQDFDEARDNVISLEYDYLEVVNALFESWSEQKSHERKAGFADGGGSDDRSRSRNRRDPQDIFDLNSEPDEY